MATKPNAYVLLIVILLCVSYNIQVCECWAMAAAGVAIGFASFAWPILEKLSGDAVAIRIQNNFGKEALVRSGIEVVRGNSVDLPQKLIPSGKQAVTGSAGAYDDSTWAHRTTAGIIGYSVTDYSVKPRPMSYCIDIMWSQGHYDYKDLSDFYGYGIAIYREVLAPQWCKKRFAKKETYKKFKMLINQTEPGSSAYGIKKDLGYAVYAWTSRNANHGELEFSTWDGQIDVVAMMTSADQGKIIVQVGPGGWVESQAKRGFKKGASFVYDPQISTDESILEIIFVVLFGEITILMVSIWFVIACVVGYLAFKYGKTRK